MPKSKTKVIGAKIIDIPGTTNKMAKWQPWKEKEMIIATVVCFQCRKHNSGHTVRDLQICVKRCSPIDPKENVYHAQHADNLY